MFDGGHSRLRLNGRRFCCVFDAQMDGHGASQSRYAFITFCEYCCTTGNNPSFLGRCGGLVVSVLALYSDDPCLNLAEANSLF